MQANWPRRQYAPLALAASGAAFSVLAVVDKVFGLVQRPLHLATVAYASLFALLVMACMRGIHINPSRLLRLSAYAGFLLLNVLTAAYLFAIRVSADPTPLMLNVQLERGDSLLDTGDKDGAHLVYREAYRRFPHSFPVLMRMGAVNYRVGDFDRAERYFGEALQEAPSDQRWRARNDLAQTQWKLGRSEEAIESYLQARQEMPEKQADLIEWHYRIAWAYFDVKNYDAAIEHYEAVAAFHGKYAAASYYNIACALAQKVSRTKDKAERDRFSLEAVRNLKLAWEGTEESEQAAFVDGLAGVEEERDPELDSIRTDAAFKSLVRELE
jgi:tetratricopeptide (TPR) repeat protein